MKEVFEWHDVFTGDCFIPQVLQQNRHIPPEPGQFVQLSVRLAYTLHGFQKAALISHQL